MVAIRLDTDPGVTTPPRNCGVELGVWGTVADGRWIGAHFMT